MKRLLLCAPLILAACLGPQEQCIATATRDLSTLRALIADTRATIERGYVLRREVETQEVFTRCRDHNGKVFACWETVTYESTRAVAVNLDAERAKLASMERKEREQVKAAARDIAACKAQFPEG
jgi:sulfatase maturation enzyme AslB (radical SAM superfamily)